MQIETIRENIAYQPLLLGVFAMITSGALAWVSNTTGPAIAAAEAADLRNSLAEVLPAGFADNDFAADTIEVLRDGKAVVIHRARKQGVVTGAVFKVAERGYAADIQVLMAVDSGGRTLGVRVVKHVETPGLGDKIEAAKSPWVRGFEGKSLGDPAPEKWAVSKDGGVFDQFAGATVTPRAVVKAVKDGLVFFAAHRDEIIGEGT